MISSSEIETIVREVLARMMASQGAATQVSPFTLHDAIISLDALRAVPSTTKVVRIPERAIVTPAARDWCRERSVALERESLLAEGRKTSGDAARNAPVIETSNATPDGLRRTATMFVAGTVEWLPGLARQLCAKQSLINERSPDDASAIRDIASALRAGHRSGIAIVQSPYSALWQSARDDLLRPAVVSQWGELSEIFREVPVNVLIVPAARWSVAGVANIARRFLDHLRSQS